MTEPAAQSMPSGLTGNIKVSGVEVPIMEKIMGLVGR